MMNYVWIITKEGPEWSKILHVCESRDVAIQKLHTEEEKLDSRPLDVLSALSRIEMNKHKLLGEQR